MGGACGILETVGQTLERTVAPSEAIRSVLAFTTLSGA